MGLDRQGTLADVIRDHARAEVEGMEIASRQVVNDRLVACCYRAIHKAMSRPGVAKSAVLDRATGLVYVPMPDGTIASFNVIHSEDVPAATKEESEEDRDHITLGETS